MNPALIKYGLIAVALIGTVSVSAWGGYKLRDNIAVAEMAKKDKALSDARDAHNAEVSRIENKQIEDTITLQGKYDEKIKALEAGNASSQQRITDLVRKARSCAGGSQVPGEAVNPGGSTQSAGGSGDGLSEGIGADFNRVGFNANKLAEIVKTCVPWALSVGR